MAGYDPWLLFLLLMAAGSVCAVVLSVVWLLRLDRRYGVAEPPEEILRIDRELKEGGARVDLSLFTPDRELNGRATHRRTLQSDDGKWDLTVELEGDDVVAFQARLTHNKSKWMNYTLQGWTRRPKIIQQDGCG